MFIDAPLPETIRRYEFTSSPRFSTQITRVASGAERRNQNWAHPLHRFNAPGAVECQEHLSQLHNMWMVTAGPLHTFPFRDPLDFASVDVPAADVAPSISALDQAIGQGDGQRTSFQLTRAYWFGLESYARAIHHPIVETVRVAMNGQPPEEIGSSLGGPYGWTVSRGSGVIEFDHAPHPALRITAGFLFDVEARFEADDSYDGIVRSYRVSGHADLTFVEVRPC